MEGAPTGIVTVEEIHKDGIEVLEYTHEYLLGYCVYPFEHLEGISLTLEILEKCGLTFDKCFFFKGERLGFSAIVLQTIDHSLKIDSPFGMTKLQYLHQLQNWFFALTGEELEMKS